MSEQKYTPTPWRVEKGTTLIWGNCNPDDFSTRGMGYPILEAKINPSGNWSKGPYADEGEANAALVVRAVNSHEALVAALEAAREGVKLLNDLTSCGADDDYVWGLEEKIDAALAAARGDQS